MNNNSKICQFIAAHDDWRERFENEYGIKVKEEPPLAIFSYGIDCDFSDPIVQEARGIIIDLETLDVVCWPFRKFANWEESYADPIDWKTARVQEKIDGSIMKLWYDHRKQQWRLSTSGMINAGEAITKPPLSYSFEALFNLASNSGNIQFDKLDKDCTYIFELVSPESQVVIRYPSSFLYHIGTRNNLTGREYNVNIGVENPREYALKTLDDCVQAAEALNKDCDGSVHDITREGFVVVDGNWNRIKVKSPDYIMLHHLSSNQSFPKRRIIDMLRRHDLNVYDICKSFPDYAHYFKYYDFKMTELDHQVDVFCKLTDRIYEEYSHDRKLVANKIKNHRLAPLAFVYLDTGYSAKECLDRMPLWQYCKWIPDYRPEKLSEAFK